ncbi:MAG: Transcriptional regulator, TetR family [Frankiales bacterium]|nr:Transcriptional regulator, TetR family [Frankiales bacterium]
MATAARIARTQGERSAAMQRRLLDATVESLSEKGYAGTTTLEVQQRAGVSRGALLHHYASRADLILAAVEHLGRQRIAEVISVAQSSAPAKDRVGWGVRVLWETFEGPLFTASLELWMAARSDRELLAVLLPQERILGQAIRSMAHELFDPESRSPELNEAIELLFDGMRGAAARGVLRAHDSDERLIASWIGLMHRYIDVPGST